MKKMQNHPIQWLILLDGRYLAVVGCFWAEENCQNDWKKGPKINQQVNFKKK